MAEELRHEKVVRSGDDVTCPDAVHPLRNRSWMLQDVN